MLEWFISLKDNIDRHGIRWGIFLTLYAVYRKERRNLRLDQRDAAMFHNLKIIMEELGRGDEWIGQVKISNWDHPNYKKLFSSLHKETQQGNKKRRIIMEKLKSRKLWLTLLGVIIPVLNVEFGINLDAGTIWTISATIIAGVIALAHVDAKKILAGLVHTKVTVKGLEVAFTTFQQAIPYLKEIHSDINKLLENVKKDDGSQAFKDAMQAYAQIKPILDSLKHPDPVAVIVEDEVSP